MVIEVDGQIHNDLEVARRDEIRIAWLQSQGLEIMRIAGIDIMQDPDEVALGIIIQAKAGLTR